jgi:hypothetical protein
MEPGFKKEYEVDNFRNYGLDQVRAMQDHAMEIAREQYQYNNPVIGVFEALGDYIKEFEAELDQDHEIGARIVQFGSSLQIHVQNVGYTPPSLITFSGKTSEGDPVQLIQHVSQLSFLLVSLKKIDEQPYRIGFIWDKD